VLLLAACATTSSQVPEPAPEIRQEKAMKLDNVRLLVTKFDESFRFWRDTMGFEVTFGQEGESYAHFVAPGGGDVGIFDRTQMAEAVGTDELPSINKAQDPVCLIFSVPNVDDSYAALVKKGAKFVRPPADKEGWGIRAAHLRDPDGNLIEIMTSLPRPLEQ
jgi:lactoylglutathione lyase